MNDDHHPAEWPAGFTLYRNPDGWDWTISLPADFAPGCLDAAIDEALCIDEALVAKLYGREEPHAPFRADTG